jgi:hypothetical protein
MDNDENKNRVFNFFMIALLIANIALLIIGNL